MDQHYTTSVDGYVTVPSGASSTSAIRGSGGEWLSVVGHSEAVPIPENFEQVEYADARSVKDIFRDLYFLHYTQNNRNNNNHDKPTSMKVVKFGDDFYNCIATGYQDNITMIDMIKLHSLNILAIKRVFINPIARALIVQVATSQALIRAHTVSVNGLLAMSTPSQNAANTSAVFEVHPLKVNSPSLDERTRTPLDHSTFANQCGGSHNPVLYRVVNDVTCGLKILHQEASLVGMPDEPTETALQVRPVDNHSVFACQAFGYRQDIMLQDMLRLYGLHPNYVTDVSYNFTDEPFNKNEQGYRGALQVMISSIEKPPLTLPTFYSFRTQHKNGHDNSLVPHSKATSNSYPHSRDHGNQLFAASVINAPQYIQHALYVPQPNVVIPNDTAVAASVRQQHQQQQNSDGLLLVAQQQKRKRDAVHENDNDYGRQYILASDQVNLQQQPPLSLSQVLQASVIAQPLLSPPLPPPTVHTPVSIDTQQIASDIIVHPRSDEYQQMPPHAPTPVPSSSALVTTVISSSAVPATNHALQQSVINALPSVSDPQQIVDGVTRSNATAVSDNNVEKQEQRPGKLRRLLRFIGFS